MSGRFSTLVGNTVRMSSLRYVVVVVKFNFSKSAKDFFKLIPFLLFQSGTLVSHG